MNEIIKLIIGIRRKKKCNLITFPPKKKRTSDIESFQFPRYNTVS